MVGFIISYRKLWDNPIFKGNALRVGVWDWMLKEAAYMPTTHIVGTEVVPVARGQLCVSQQQIIDGTGMARQQLRTFLNILEKTHTISTRPASKATKGKTLITICKYEEYQSGEMASNQASTKDQPKTNQLKKQGNKVTREETKVSLSPSAKKTASGSRLSEDWFLPKQWGDDAVESGAWPELIRNEADKFKDYWIGVAGAKARKANWEATWRNWIRKAIDDNHNHKPQLKAISGGRTNERTDFDTNHREYARRIGSGEIQRGPDASDPFAGG